MIITNVLLIHSLNASKNKVHDLKNISRVKPTSVTVLTITSLFIFMTLPNAVANGFFTSELLKTRSGTAILTGCDCLGFTFHSFNFVSLFFANKQFAREVKSIFNTIKAGKRNSNGATNTTSLQLKQKMSKGNKTLTNAMPKL